MTVRAGTLGVAAAAALAVGIGAGWWLRGHDESAAVPPAEAADERIEALQARLDRLEARSPSSSSPRAPGTRPEPPPLPVSQEQRQAQMLAERERLSTALETAFAGAGPVRPNDATAQKINEALADPAVLAASGLPENEEVVCRATLCLVRANFAAGTDSSEWVDRLLLAMAGAAPSASVTPVARPDGGVEVRIYASRPGDPAPIQLAMPRR